MLLLLDASVDLGYVTDEDGTVHTVEIPDHIRRAQEQLIPYFAQHQEWQDLIAIMGERAQWLELATLSVLSMLSWEGAQGEWLKWDAANMGVGGTTWTESQWRRLRDARRHVNHASGTWEAVVRLVIEGMRAVDGTFARTGQACIYAGYLVDYVPDADFRAEIGRYFCNDSIQDGAIPAGVGYGLVEAITPGFRLDIGMGLDQGGLGRVVVQS